MDLSYLLVLSVLYRLLLWWLGFRVGRTSRAAVSLLPDWASKGRSKQRIRWDPRGMMPADCQLQPVCLPWSITRPMPVHSQDAANLNIHVCFTALVLPSATQSSADECGFGFDRSIGSGLGDDIGILQPLISNDAGVSADGGGTITGGGASGLSWRSAGVAVQLDASMAAFMADLAPHENCTVEVCRAGGPEVHPTPLLV